MTLSLALNGPGLNIWLAANVFLVICLLFPIFSVAHTGEAKIIKRMAERAEALGMELRAVHDPILSPKLDGSTTTIDQFIETCGPGESDKHRFTEWLNQHIEPHDRDGKFYTAQLAYNLLYWLKINKKFAENDTYHSETSLKKMTENLMDIMNKPERTLKSFIDTFFQDSKSTECTNFMEYLRSKQNPTLGKKLVINDNSFYNLAGLYEHYMEWIVDLMAKDHSHAHLESESTKPMVELIKNWRENKKLGEGADLSRPALYMVEQQLWKLEPVDDTKYDPGKHMTLTEFKAFLARELRVYKNTMANFQRQLERNHKASLEGVFDDVKYSHEDLFLNFAHWFNNQRLKKEGYMHIKHQREDVKISAHSTQERFKEKLYVQNHLFEIIEKAFPKLYGKKEFQVFARNKGHSHLEFQRGIVWDPLNVGGLYEPWTESLTPEEVVGLYLKQDFNKEPRTQGGKHGTEKGKIDSEGNQQLPNIGFRDRLNSGYQYVKNKVKLFWERILKCFGIGKSK